MKILVNDLDLIFCPFSNQEGVWASEDMELRDYLKHSKIYMIVHREELIFVEYSFMALRREDFSSGTLVVKSTIIKNWKGSTGLVGGSSIFSFGRSLL